MGWCELLKENPFHHQCTFLTYPAIVEPFIMISNSVFIVRILKYHKSWYLWALEKTLVTNYVTKRNLGEDNLSLGSGC